MVLVHFDRLPQGLRVKLPEGKEEKLWSKVEDKGVSSAADCTGFKASKVYNWRSKGSALPPTFISEFVKADEIKYLKGEGSGAKVEGLKFPLDLSQELLTRVACSVSVNRDGTPFYITGESSLVKRFSELLQKELEASATVYSREDRFELRYPACLQKVFESIEFEKGLPAAVDEQGAVENGAVKALNREKDVNIFSGRLYSRRKRYRLAVEREDKEVLKQLVGEASKVSKLLNR
ncbi:MAG: hypothetical protein ABEJ93_01385 [Candidatus Nanohalobium sp.]